MSGIFLIGFLLISIIHLNSQVQSRNLDWERLQRGEILVAKIRDDQGIPGIQARFTISGTREELWGMLTDYVNFSQIYCGIDSVLLINENEYGARVRIYQDVKIRKLQFVLHRIYENPGYRLSWERVSGDLKMVKGSWDILDTPEDDKKLVVYTSYFKYGGMVPARLSRNWAMKEVQIMGLNARQWIRKNRYLYRL